MPESVTEEIDRLVKDLTEGPLSFTNDGFLSLSTDEQAEQIRARILDIVLMTGVGHSPEYWQADSIVE